jgi:Zn-dependent M28 family amino/carboxypeptidase
MAQQNVPMKIDVDLQVQFFGEDTNGYNTIAEIPGTDLKDEVVMLGAHLDSFHMGTGATDNGTGVAVCMEAARILTTLKLQPRRTIRVGLWTGEEQGLLGSRAYVRQHLGTNAGRDLTASTEPSTQAASAPGSQPARSPEYQNFCVYFNTDDGAGRCRGLMIGNNPAAAELFRGWVKPLADLGCSTVSLALAGSTDLTSFDSIGLNAVNFIQDPLEYWSKTWHTSQDLYDRVPPEDMRVSSTVMATLIYQAATSDQRIPRRPGN